jgi:PAS domain S-box-containing protein
MNRGSIRSQLRRIIMATSTAALLLAGATFFAAGIVNFRNSHERDVTTLAEVIGSNSTAALTFGDQNAAAEILAALRAKPSVVAATIFAHDGTVFATYGGRAHSDGMSVKRPIVFEGKTIGTIEIVSDMRDLRQLLARTGAVVAGMLALSLLLAWIISTRLQRAISGPIVALAETARQVSRDKDYSIRVPVADTAPAELAGLVHGFNEMLGEIHHRDDILEQQVADRTEELRAASRNKQMILNSAGDGIFGLDTNGVATFVNPSAARMLGASDDDLIGRDIHQFIHADADATAREQCAVCSSSLQNATRSGQTEFALATGGRHIPVEYMASTIIDDHGEATGVVVTFHDITERLAMERMKDEFVSTVSHELRTPLTSIRGALGLLSSGLLGNVNPRAQRMMEIAVSNTDRLIRLINDILDIERMQAGRVELNQRDTSPRQLVQQAIDVMQTMAEKEQVRIVCGAMPEGALWVDPDRMQQMLTNLLSNAIKFSPPSTTVTVSGRSDGKTFTFSVEDEGRGIPPEKLDSVFERFRQVDSSDSRDKGGSGLGLAICRSIAVAHGGRIWAERREPAGTRFQIALPVRVTAQDSGPRDRTILVCEEDRSKLPHLMEVLGRNDFRVITAETIEDIREQAARLRPDTILFDFLGPASLHREIIDSIRCAPETRGIPVVIAAADGPMSIDQNAEKIVTLIAKSYGDSELLDAVARACDVPTVLIVEDDIDLAGIMMASLQQHGVKTIHAANGTEAIEACTRQTPDLLILDLILPQMDGFSVIEWLKRRSVLADVPLLVYSALEVGAAEQRRFRLGPTEFLTKGRTPVEDLGDHVVRLLDSITTPLEVLHVA